MNYLIALIAGATIFLGLSPYDLWYVALLGVLIYAVLWRPYLTAKQSFLLALSFHFGMFAAGINWLYVSIHTYGQMPAPLAALCTLGFAFFIGLISSLPWLLSPLFKGSGRMLAFPGLWLLSEWGRGWILTGFPWLYLGQAHLHTPLAGWTPVVGVLGTGFAVALSMIAVIVILTQRSLSAVVAHSLILVVLWGGGHLLKRAEWTAPLGSNVSATLIQPNIPLTDKWDRSQAQTILNILHESSGSHWSNNLIVWPEAAIPYVGEEARAYLGQIDDRAATENAALISGYLTYDPDTGRYHNAVGGVGLAQGEYLKQRLVPFGEYVPLEDWLRGLMHFFNLPMSIISPGPGGQSLISFVQDGETYVVAPAICYEIAYPALVADLAREANLIVTLSNDAWFGNSIGPWQHAQIAQIRALENRKPVLRVTNNGITSSIDHRGNVLDVLPQFQTGALQTEVMARSGNTPYSRYGNYPVLLAGLCAFIVSFLVTKVSRPAAPLQ